MTEYVATCNASHYDTITARLDGDAVELRADHNGEHMLETYLSASKARTFARGILALADEVDGEEVVEASTPETRAPEVGDRVRIVRDDPYTKPGAFVGRTGVLREAKADGRGKPYRVRLDDPSGTWDEGSWWVEKVTLVDEPEPVLSRHAAHVRTAKALLAGVEHTSAADVIALAQFLADE
jgi:hypothetical protein